MTNTGHPDDFDFQVGDWIVHHRRLKGRLIGATEWEDFTGACTMRKILGGHGNVEDNLIRLPGDEYRAVALRAFDTKTRTWAIWWLDGRSPHRLDVPVIGGFENGVGSFFADDILDHRPIRIRFTWRARAGEAPTWEQAFSADAGATWETNWTMRFERI